jgi:hypothetical protein
MILPLDAPAEAAGETEIHAAIRDVVAHSGASVAPHPAMRQDYAASRLGRLIAPRRATAGTHADHFAVVSDVALWIAFRDAPCTSRGEIPRFVNAETWPRVAASPAEHRAHIEICDLGMVGRNLMAPPDAAFNRAVAVTAAAAALTRFVSPLAMLWHPARAAIPPSSFRDQIGRLLGGQAPLELWMRWFLLRGGEGENPGVITRGLRSFSGREIEVRPSSRSEAEALALAFAAASLMIDKGRVFQDGEMLAPMPGQNVRVRLGESSARAGLPVVELSATGPVRPE